MLLQFIEPMIRTGEYINYVVYSSKNFVLSTDYFLLNGNTCCVSSVDSPMVKYY